MTYLRVFEFHSLVAQKGLLLTTNSALKIYRFLRVIFTTEIKQNFNAKQIMGNS